jgi:hypothetical protein
MRAESGKDSFTRPLRSLAHCFILPFISCPVDFCEFVLGVRHGYDKLHLPHFLECRVHLGYEWLSALFRPEFGEWIMKTIENLAFTRREPAAISAVKIAGIDKIWPC